LLDIWPIGTDKTNQIFQVRNFANSPTIEIRFSSVFPHTLYKIIGV